MIPHFNTFGTRWVDSAGLARPEVAVLLALDERTAAVWSSEGWRALGAGTVTVFSDGGEPRVFRPGERIEGLPEPA